MLLEIWDDCFSDDTTNLINHEDRDQVDSEHLNVKLVDSNIEQVKLEISELKDKSFDEYRVVESTLSFVVLQLSCPDGNFTELLVHYHGYDSLCN